MHKYIERVLVSQEEIVARAKELGKIISADYKDKAPVFVGLLKGSIPFMAELIKYCDIDGMETDFMDVSSYDGGTCSTFNIKILKDLDRDINGADILVVEDIVDTGLTLQKVFNLMKNKGAKTVKVVTLLNKKEGRKVDVVPDYVGFEIPNEFVIGFGLDYEERYRQLPYVGVFKPEVYNKE